MNKKSLCQIAATAVSPAVGLSWAGYEHGKRKESINPSSGGRYLWGIVGLFSGVAVQTIGLLTAHIAKSDVVAEFHAQSYTQSSCYEVDVSHVKLARAQPTTNVERFLFFATNYGVAKKIMSNDWDSITHVKYRTIFANDTVILHESLHNFIKPELARYTLVGLEFVGQNSSRLTSSEQSELVSQANTNLATVKYVKRNEQK